MQLDSTQFSFLFLYSFTVLNRNSKLTKEIQFLNIPMVARTLQYQKFRFVYLLIILRIHFFFSRFAKKSSKSCAAADGTVIEEAESAGGAVLFAGEEPISKAKSFAAGAMGG